MTDIVSASRRALLDALGLLTEHDLALALEISTNTLREWRQPRSTTKGPAFSKLGKQVYYRRADVQKWIAENLRTEV